MGEVAWTSLATSTDATNLFAEPPTIDSTGTLTFKPAPNSQGTALVTVVKKNVVVAAEREEFATAGFIVWRPMWRDWGVREARRGVHDPGSCGMC